VLKYFRKMRGGGQRPRGVGVFEIVWSWLASFVGIAAVAWIHHDLVAGGDLVMLIGSFGASAVMLAVALLMNNMVPSRKYPLFWF
jgi:hypothetical protein